MPYLHDAQRKKDKGCAQRYKIAAHKKTGKTYLGICNHLDTNSAELSLSLYNKKGVSLNKVLVLPYDALKAVFVVKDFKGNIDHPANEIVLPSSGSPVAVEFVDGEVIYTRPPQPGWEKAKRIVLQPANKDGNTKLILANRSAIKAIYSLNSFQQRQQRNFRQFAEKHYRPGQSVEECRGDYYFARGDYWQASEFYFAAFEGNSSNQSLKHKLWVTKYNIATQHIKNKEYDSALRYMQLVLDLEPGNIRATERMLKLKDHLRVRDDLENVNLRIPAHMDSKQFRYFNDYNWILENKHFILTGPAHSGKTRLACLLGHQASKKGCEVRYYHVPGLLEIISETKHQDMGAQTLDIMENADFLILDHWRNDAFNEGRHPELREIIKRRYMRHATLFIAELPGDQWHLLFGERPSSDPLLYKLLYDAHKIHMEPDCR